MWAAVVWPASASSTETPGHAAHVDPHAGPAHAAHAAAEHLEYFTDVDAPGHAAFAEVETLHALAHVAVLVEPLLVLLPALFRVWKDIVGFI